MKIWREQSLKAKTVGTHSRFVAHRCTLLSPLLLPAANLFHTPYPDDGGCAPDAPGVGTRGLSRRLVVPTFGLLSPRAYPDRPPRSSLSAPLTARDRCHRRQAQALPRKSGGFRVAGSANCCKRRRGTRVGVKFRIFLGVGFGRAGSLPLLLIVAWSRQNVSSRADYQSLKRFAVCTSSGGNSWSN